jgi:hypothetical protein
VGVQHPGNQRFCTYARRLAAQAYQVGRVSGRQPWREALRWISRGWLGRHAGWPSVPQLDTPWRDTVSAERSRSPALPRAARLRVVWGSRKRLVDQLCAGVA